MSELIAITRSPWSDFQDVDKQDHSVNPVSAVVLARRLGMHWIFGFHGLVLARRYIASDLARTLLLS
jgi:hypothetical protein